MQIKSLSCIDKSILLKQIVIKPKYISEKQSDFLESDLIKVTKNIKSMYYKYSLSKFDKEGL